MLKNSLIIVGIGIQFLSHISAQAKAYIEQSHKLLYLVNEPLTEEWLKELNSSSESLDKIYHSYQRRLDSYQAITAHIIRSVEEYKQVCVAIYGHPTVFAKPALDAAIQVKQQNMTVKIFPAISAEDCLFADCMLDPGQYGCQSFEATDFLIHKRLYDCNSHLVLWQIGIIGNIYHQPQLINQPRKALTVLLDYLAEKYPLDHRVIIYEAALYPTFEPRIENIMLKDLVNSQLSKISTLYIPPLRKSAYDSEILCKLGIDLDELTPQKNNNTEG